MTSESSDVTNPAWLPNLISSFLKNRYQGFLPPTLPNQTGAHESIFSSFQQEKSPTPPPPPPPPPLPLLFLLRGCQCVDQGVGRGGEGGKGGGKYDQKISVKDFSHPKKQLVQ